MKKILVVVSLILLVQMEASANQALTFDGQGDYAVIESSSALNSQVFTIEAWVLSNNTHNKYWFSRTTTTASEGDGVLVGFGKGRIYFYLNGKQFIGKSNITIGEWRHIALTYNGATALLYLNGVLEGSFPCSTSFSYNSAIYLGIDQDSPNGGLDSSQFFGGLLDEVRIWDIVRSESEIRNSMRSSISGVTYGLVGYWPLDDGTFRDKSQYSNISYLNGARIIQMDWMNVSFAPAKEGVVRQNYPNPFNAETWIPYELSKSTDVTIKIFDIKGSLIRTLDIGVKGAGIHSSKSESVYWDGRDKFGQQVSSGIYFYKLQSSVGKMVIKK